MHNLDAAGVSNSGQGDIGLAMGEEVATKVEAGHLESLTLGLLWHLVNNDISRGASNLVGCEAVRQRHWELLPSKCERKRLRLADADDPRQKKRGAPVVGLDGPQLEHVRLDVDNDVLGAVAVARLLVEVA